MNTILCFQAAQRCSDSWRKKLFEKAEQSIASLISDEQLKSVQNEAIVKTLQTLVDKKKAEPFLWESWNSMERVSKRSIDHGGHLVLIANVQKTGLFCSDLVVSVLSIHIVMTMGWHKMQDKNTIGKPIGALALAATAVSIYFRAHGSFIR